MKGNFFLVGEVVSRETSMGKLTSLEAGGGENYLLLSEEGKKLKFYFIRGLAGNREAEI